MEKFKLSKEMKELIAEIDVSDSYYEKATNRYNSIANYIKESNLSEYNPDIFIQGSVKLGTAIKPISEDGAYDIDIVCNFEKLTRKDQTQKELKYKIGTVIRDYSKEKSMKDLPDEGKRCWTINYVDDYNFHIDILPSVPYNYISNNIAITDKHNEYYTTISENWEVSNPKDYFEWFQKESNFKILMENYKINAGVEKVPEYKIKTPLQRIVQLLKRHAEIMFEDSIDYKPTSVIITTLVTKAYIASKFSSKNFEDLLCKTINNIEYGIDYNDNKPMVLNPVNNQENLSLKWEIDNEYFAFFKNWLLQLKSDFNSDNLDILPKERLVYIQRSLHRDKNEIGVALNNLPQHKKLKWFFLSSKLVNIKTFYSFKGFREKQIKTGDVVNKNGDLKFVAVCDNIGDYNVYWQITNTGIEAKQANCLRGDFYDSKVELGKKIRKETTAYLGRHYVEAYIVKNDICYGKSEPFEVNITKKLTFNWLEKRKY